MWGATPSTAREGIGAWDFNPRSPCGERLGLEMPEYILLRISIHAPRVGSDSGINRENLLKTYFNPRSPCGERHRAGDGIPWLPDFNPRSPCGERPLSAVVLRPSAEFQSTLPVWGATALALHASELAKISIHAPRVGSDAGFDCHFDAYFRDFNPRSPCGERRYATG